mmetsp:Transcript_30027/g.67336  ORF Transcript_30027/g.67336 Transcript_30027/m.67336 type:complete len:205 (-) Transcript_30027:224-838(-)
MSPSIITEDLILSPQRESTSPPAPIFIESACFANCIAVSQRRDSAFHLSVVEMHIDFTTTSLVQLHLAAPIPSCDAGSPAVRVLILPITSIESPIRNPHFLLLSLWCSGRRGGRSNAPPWGESSWESWSSQYATSMTPVPSSTTIAVLWFARLTIEVITPNSNTFCTGRTFVRTPLLLNTMQSTPSMRRRLFKSPMSNGVYDQY